MDEEPIHMLGQDDRVYDNAHLQQAARDHLWMHFTRHSGYEKADVPSSCAARAPTSATRNGKRYLDGLAGLFVSQLGHGRTELAEAAAKQAEQLAFMPLWSYAHPNAIELAERVADYAPGDLNRVFFTTGGGEAVETAWKLAKNYFKLTGKPNKHKVISRAIAYHGTPQGALSITGLPGHEGAVRAAGALDVPGAEHQLLPRARTSRTTTKKFGRWAADQIAVAIENEGPDTVAAVFLEPVQNSGGCFPPPPGYFERVREICDEYDVLLVTDEVICAFGRLGHMFGAERYGYQPDMITCAKGITSGYAPLGAMIATDRLMEPFLTGSETFAPRLHLRRPPGLDRGRDGQPRHLREARRSTSTSARTRPPSARPWRSSRTCRSSATSAATATSTASSWSRTRPPRRPSTTRSPRSCCAASCPRRCTTRASTAAPTTAATRSSSSLPR